LLKIDFYFLFFIFYFIIIYEIKKEEKYKNIKMVNKKIDSYLNSFYKNGIIFMYVHGMCNSEYNHNCLNVYGTDNDGNSYNIENCPFVSETDNNGNTQFILTISENEILISNKWK